MTDQKKSDQRDANLAAETRPVPSQAEGDTKTVEQDLLEKEPTGKPESKTKKS